ncbi:MAG TPA: aminotransferase class III-fold pyridoxal phosphate-dependent enzyme, partial [Acidimicrobiales bacterium]|nr:aminotransferase class III-fold pyridoxal phosphate-dependent enzyme [Acidimicrobiales bacterium]
AVSRQMERLVHVSNLFYTEPMVELAEALTLRSGLDRVFFANCGATANEAAIKLARRHGQAQGGPERHRILTLDDSFHGRTLATLAATGQPAKQATFQPLPPGFAQVPPEDLAALEEAVDDTVAAVMLETIQGEGGVRPLSGEYLRAVRQLCDERGTLLVVDDVQAGMGRTGTWFSWQQLGFEPDIATTAKALANGLPIGAAMATEAVASAFQPGDHATTFGGGPVVCAAALAVIDEIDSRHLLANCRERSSQLMGRLADLPGVAAVRGRGLLVAAQLEKPVATEAVRRALVEQHLIVNAVRPDAVRLAPPLTVAPDEIDEAVERLAAVLA